MENIHDIIDNIIVENNNGEITAKSLNLLLHEIADSSSALYIKMPDSCVIKETEWGNEWFLQIKDNSIIEHNKNVYEQIMNAFDENKIPEIIMVVDNNDGYSKFMWCEPEFGLEKVCGCYKCLLTEELISYINYVNNDTYKLSEHIGEYGLLIEGWNEKFVLFSNGDMTLNISDKFIDEW